MKLVVLLIWCVAAAGFTWAILHAIVPWWNRRIGRYVSWFVDHHEAMHEPLSTARARLIISAAILGPLSLGYAVGGLPPAILFTILGGVTPYAWVRHREKTRVRQLDDQLVDTFVLMANGMRSGLSLLQAIELATEEARRPLSDELDILLKEIRLGVGVDEALVKMADRLGLPDLEIAVHSIVTLRQTGGNLSETFMTVAQTVMERKKVEGKIATVTAQGLYQGIMVCGMPFVLAAVFYLVDPDYMRPMFTTLLGWAVWVVVILLDILGMWLILKIVKVDV